MMFALMLHRIITIKQPSIQIVSALQGLSIVLVKGLVSSAASYITSVQIPEDVCYGQEGHYSSSDLRQDTAFSLCKKEEQV